MPTEQPNGNGHEDAESEPIDPRSPEAACARVHATEGAAFCSHCGSFRQGDGTWAKPAPPAPARRTRDDR